MTPADIAKGLSEAQKDALINDVHYVDGRWTAAKITHEGCSVVYTSKRYLLEKGFICLNGDLTPWARMSGRC